MTRRLRLTSVVRSRLCALDQLRVLALPVHALLLAALVVLVLILQGPAAFHQTLPTDWTAFATGGRMILHGHGGILYDVAAQQHEQALLLNRQLTGLPLPFADLPLFAVLVAPLAALPLPVSLVLWSALLVAALAGSVVVLASLAPATWSRGQRVVVALACCGTLPMVSSIEFGQVVVIGLLGLSLAVRYALRHGDSLPTGLLLGIVAVKPQYVWMVLPLLLATRLWRTAAGFGITGLVWVGSALAIVGPAGMVSWLTQFLPGAFARQVTWGTGLPGVLNAAGLPVGWATAASILVGAGLTVVALRFWREARSNPARVVVLAVLIGTLLAPHSFDWDIALVGVPLFLLSATRPWPALILVAAFDLLTPAIQVRLVGLPLHVATAVVAIALVSWIRADRRPQEPRPSAVGVIPERAEVLAATG